MKKRNGFTLVELLAVILILSMIMIIGSKAVVPIIVQSKKKNLVNEGIGLISSSKSAHESEMSKESDMLLSDKESVCFSLGWLKEHNYYDKDDNDYQGSVYVHYNEDSNSYDYTFWITNGEFHIEEGRINNYTVLDGGGDPETIVSCGGRSVRKLLIMQEEKPAYTGYIYRHNDAVTDLKMPYNYIEGEQWVYTSGSIYEFFHPNYKDEETCLQRASILDQEYNNRSCVKKTGSFEGTRTYFTTLGEFIANKYDVYCPGENRTNCAVDWYWETEEGCLTEAGASVCTHLKWTNFPIYLKHYIVDDLIENTQTCVYYKNTEFCIGPDFVIKNDPDRMLNMAKLESAMEGVFGENIDCTINYGNIVCSPTLDDLISCPYDGIDRFGMIITKDNVVESRNNWGNGVWMSCSLSPLGDASCLTDW